MLVLLPLSLLLAGQAGGLSPGNLGEELYYASIAASGSKLCDRQRAKRYGKQFDERYGARVRALVNYHESRFGPDPGFVFTSDCHGSRASNREQDRAHAEAMDRFETELSRLERRFGPAE